MDCGEESSQILSPQSLERIEESWSEVSHLTSAHYKFARLKQQKKLLELKLEFCLAIQHAIDSIHCSHCSLQGRNILGDQISFGFKDRHLSRRFKKMLSTA
jgi:hypothetical protein